MTAAELVEQINLYPDEYATLGSEIEVLVRDGGGRLARAVRAERVIINDADFCLVIDAEQT